MNFPTGGADTFDEGAKLRLLGYYTKLSEKTFSPSDGD